MSVNTELKSNDSDPLSLSNNAAGRVKALIQQEGNPNLKLRVYITGGGCSGFQYGFKFDEKVNDGDTEVSNDGVSVVVDPMSIQYLMGAEVDFVEGLQGSMFVIKNPNASSTCGCGASFSV
jgi:iron-sulfur cluster insertion protein